MMEMHLIWVSENRNIFAKGAGQAISENTK